MTWYFDIFHKVKESMTFSIFLPFEKKLKDPSLDLPKFVSCEDSYMAKLVLFEDIGECQNYPRHSSLYACLFLSPHNKQEQAEVLPFCVIIHVQVLHFRHIHEQFWIISVCSLESTRTLENNSSQIHRIIRKGGSSCLLIQMNNGPSPLVKDQCKGQIMRSTRANTISWISSPL